MRRKKLWIIGGLVLTLGIVGAVAAKPVGSAILASISCGQVTELNEARNDSQPVSDGERTMVILGDSYAQGQYLDQPREDAWSTVAAERLGWEAYVNATGGTGLTNPGRCGDGLFIDRVPAVLAHAPARVIIQTGLNEDPRRVAEAAAAVLDELGDVPEVTVVGPVLAPSYDAAKIRAVDAALSEAADAAGRDYVSMLDLNLQYIDGLHMTASGHETYAEAVSERLTQ